jgi:ATP-dependent helicase/nuclease subunit A
MTTIKIISASAGSGKTTRLARLLEESVTSGQVRPDAIVATTFTTKAAAELSERARRQLLRAGRVDDAHRLGAARIGTVNSVCDRLVADFALELGLPPRLRVIEERLAAEQLSRAMAAAVSPEISQELTALTRRMEALDWQSDVRRLIESCRSNDIALDSLDRCAERSTRAALGLFGAAEADGATLDAALVSGLERFLAGYEAGDDTTKRSAAAADVARSALGRLRSGARLLWREWAKLAGLQVGKRSREHAELLHEAAAAHDRHPALQRDVARAIALVYAVARQTLASYQARKREWGVIDFVDQEVLALGLLRRDDVRRRLAGSIDLVLVDEFQDTSPLQLAIFLELAKIAPRSVWVGDQKQAIYGFRGTDPKLMNAALEEFLEGTDAGLVQDVVEGIVADGQPETLSISYRSRPELVRLTSAIFTRAFATHGMPEARVRLEPASDDEPAGLGPIVEYWPLKLADRRKTTQLQPAVAEGVRRLLADPSQQVRERQTGEVRRALPGDVAVLCRTNAQCLGVATALEAHGIRALVAKSGLLDTAEGRLAIAALRLWIDRGDRVAAAELRRLIDFPDQPDAWLSATLTARNAPGSGSEPSQRSESQRQPDVVATLRAAAATYGALGPVEALDCASDAIGLRQLCHRWGDASRRLANLDALRSHATRYVEESGAAGEAPTTTGLLGYLLALADDAMGKVRQDDQAVRQPGQAVTVTTWHRAKGLEWPITVLFGLERQRERDALGVNVVSDRETFQIDDPLGERWVRYLPTPYHFNQRYVPFVERLASDPQNKALQQESRREALRLLYVGWTRARDRLVLAADERALFKGILGTLREIDEELLCEPNDDATTIWAGRVVDVPIHPTEPTEPTPPAPAPDRAYLPGQRREHPRAYVAPSTLESNAIGHQPTHPDGSELELDIATTVEIGAPIEVREGADLNAVGNALHAFYASDSPTRAPDRRLADASALLSAWGAADALPADALVASADALLAWIAQTWPDAQRQREWPIMHRLPSGSIVRGSVDLVVELDDRLVVIDHKCIGGDLAQVLERAARYRGQLAAYGAALASATGKTIEGLWLHLPLNGRVIAVIGQQRQGQAG